MRKQIFCSILLALLIIGNSIAVTKGFDENPTFTDTFGDGPDGSFEDIKYVWVDNNETFINFKLELAGPINSSFLSSTFIRVLISLDNTTGVLITDIRVHYQINWVYLGDGPTDWGIGFQDRVNDTNSLEGPNVEGMAYFRWSNSNTTFEVGYKLRTYSEGVIPEIPRGVGYLNLALGQSIALKFMVGEDSYDFAPNMTDGAIPYTLKGGPAPPSGIPGFESVLVVACIFTLLLFYLDRRHLPKP